MRTARWRGCSDIRRTSCSPLASRRCCRPGWCRRTTRFSAGSAASGRRPFYTTKPIGEGTGLGLAICHNIVHDIGGEILVESELGKGTTFRVVLPVSRARVEKTPVAVPAVVVGRRVRMLLVDDEPSVGRSLQRLLGERYELTTFTSAREALRYLAGGPSIDVLLTDLMMPEMTGMALYAELERTYPLLAQRTIFVSGGTFTAGAQEFLQRHRGRILEKPFDEVRLRALIGRKFT